MLMIFLLTFLNALR